MSLRFCTLFPYLCLSLLTIFLPLTSTAQWIDVSAFNIQESDFDLASCEYRLILRHGEDGQSSTRYFDSNTTSESRNGDNVSYKITFAADFDTLEFVTDNQLIDEFYYQSLLSDFANDDYKGKNLRFVLEYVKDNSPIVRHQIYLAYDFFTIANHIKGQEGSGAQTEVNIPLINGDFALGKLCSGNAGDGIVPDSITCDSITQLPATSASAKPSYNAFYGGSNLIDGIRKSYRAWYSTTKASSATLNFDLGVARALQTIRLYEQYPILTPSSFSVSVSEDGLNYQEVSVNQDGFSDHIELTLSSTTRARFVRIEVGPSPGTYISLAEVEFEGCAL